MLSTAATVHTAMNIYGFTMTCFSLFIPRVNLKVFLLIFLVSPLLVAKNAIILNSQGDYSWEKPESMIISDTEIKELGDLVDNLLKEFPPKQHFYILLGRSPTLISAELKSRNLRAYNIPASEIYSNYPVKIKRIEQLFTESPRFAKFDNYLDHFIPFIEFKRRTAVVVDYGGTGRSLAVFRNMVLYSTKKRGVEKEPVGVIISGKNKSELTQEISSDQRGVFHAFTISKESELYRKFSDQKYGRLAEYPFIPLAEAVSEYKKIEHRPEFPRLVTQLQAWHKGEPLPNDPIIGESRVGAPTNACSKLFSKILGLFDWK